MTQGTWQIDQLWYTASILRFRNFYWKKPKNWVVFFPFFCLLYSAIWIHKRVQEVPEYGSRFPSTGPSSRVRVQYKQNQYIEVPEYGFWQKSPKFLKSWFFFRNKNFFPRNNFCLLYSGTWTRTLEPGPKKIPSMRPVLGNLDPYLGTWTRTREPRPLLWSLYYKTWSF